MKSLVVLGVVNALVVLVLSGTAEQKSKNCNEVRAAYSSKGFNVNDVPNKGVNGEFWTTGTFGNFNAVMLFCCPPTPPLPKWGSGPPVGPGEESWGSRG